MSYHSDYWVAVATVAPVLALGHLFAVTSGLDLGQPDIRLAAIRHLASGATQKPSGWRYAKDQLRSPAFYLAFIGVIAVTQCGTSCLEALTSLSAGHDDSRTVNTIRLSVALFLLIPQVALSNFTSDRAENLKRQAAKEYEALIKRDAESADAPKKAELDKALAHLAELEKKFRHVMAEHGVAWEFYEDHYENLLDDPPRRPKPGNGSVKTTQ